MMGRRFVSVRETFAAASADIVTRQIFRLNIFPFFSFFFLSFSLIQSAPSDLSLNNLKKSFFKDKKKKKKLKKKNRESVQGKSRRDFLSVGNCRLLPPRSTSSLVAFKAPGPIRTKELLSIVDRAREKRGGRTTSRPFWIHAPNTQQQRRRDDSHTQIFAPSPVDSLRLFFLPPKKNLIIEPKFIISKNSFKLNEENDVRIIPRDTLKHFKT